MGPGCQRGGAEDGSGRLFSKEKAHSQKLLSQDGEEVVEVFGQLWSVPSPRKARVPPPGGGWSRFARTSSSPKNSHQKIAIL